ncbi:MAG: DUF305 domain-containing protein [Actinomycetota bacterium]|nr:DUF305 domain-containing protein [Actinomycetota bacterium]
MSSFPRRAVAALAASAVAAVLTACGSPAESAENAQADGPQLEAPVITGEPAGYNAADVAFASSMVPHHKQAVELATMAPEHTDNPAVLAVADQIAATQVPEINILNVFLVQWNENPEIGSGGHAGHGQSMQGSMQGTVDDATLARLESLQGPEFDTLWLESMISHHQGAIQMAEAEVADGENVDAVAMAEMMVSTQQAEIEQMRQILEGTGP